jgi:Ca2+/H+ antiporter
VRSVSNFILKTHILDSFVGLILVFIIRNAAEYMIAVVMTFRDKLDFAIGIVLDSGV